MEESYSSFKIEESLAADIASKLYRVKGKIIPLPGELDFNFHIIDGEDEYILKVSRPDVDAEEIELQAQIIDYIAKDPSIINPQKIIPDVNGNLISEIEDTEGRVRIVRLLSWISGRLWSSANPKKDELLYSLGNEAGSLTKALQGFDSKYAHRKIDWDIAGADWTYEYLNNFTPERQKIISFFQNKFRRIQKQYKSLRKSVVHNDVNDNNIIVTNNISNPKVKTIIDFGDSVYTQIINDIAITAAYAMMGKHDPLGASLHVINGYHEKFPLLEEELSALYTLIAMRLVISVTKSAINKKKEPDNEYLLISERQAWSLLENWMKIDEDLAHFSFRNTCGFSPVPNEMIFKSWASRNSFSLNDMFPKQSFDSVLQADMSVSSAWLGNESDYNDNNIFATKILQLQKSNPDKLITGGYLEIRPFYITDNFKREGNNGPEYRSAHLGIDFWIDAGAPIHSPLDAKVFSLHNNSGEKDYGPTLILEHEIDEQLVFYTLYGHLSESSLTLLSSGQSIKKGEVIGFVGSPPSNGNWTPHLHFQVMLSLLGNVNDFPGVAFPEEILTWKSICPDPNILFKESGLTPSAMKDAAELTLKRKKLLGRSLSLAYKNPLQMVRGSGVYLIDNTGRRYLDTVNNVAHVGHERPRVVKAGQKQMALLNTNTRYLHDKIVEFAEELLAVFPPELSVVYFVNSGSEANELALRMARTCTGQKDIIAVEVGYHGNTSGCIDISSYKFDGKGGNGAPEFTHIVPLPDKFRGIYTGDNTGKLYAAHINEMIGEIKSKDRNVAAFICESIISCGGQIELPEDYLTSAYKAVKDSGGLCIADEVQVGCGRVGSKFWAFQLHDVIPDIVTIGKPIGNGHPLAAVVCTKQVAETFANGMEYFNTFGGNPVSCAIGLEVLHVIKDEKLMRNALEVGGYLKAGLKNLQKKFPLIGDVRGQGLFLGFELVDKDQKPQPDKAAYLAERMRELGILMSADGKDNNVLKIKPPMVFSTNNADELLSRLEIVLNEDFMIYDKD